MRKPLLFGFLAQYLGSDNRRVLSPCVTFIQYNAMVDFALDCCRRRFRSSMQVMAEAFSSRSLKALIVLVSAQLPEVIDKLIHEILIVYSKLLRRSFIQFN